MAVNQSYRLILLLILFSTLGIECRYTDKRGNINSDKLLRRKLISMLDSLLSETKRDHEVGTSELPVGQPEKLSFDHSTYTVDVLEYTTPPYRIAIVHATAGQDGDNVTYGFSQKTEELYGDLFDIVPEFGKIYLVGPVDYEKVKQYELFVQAKSPNLGSATCRVVVNIIDVNDNAPEVVINALTQSGRVEVVENRSPGVFVAHISVHDADSGENGRFYCHLYGADGTFELIQMYSTEYKLITVSTFDREMIPAYDIELVCTDNGDLPRRTIETLRVDIADENDNAPYLITDVYSTSIRENSTVGTTITTVNASDMDAGRNAEISYEFVPDAVSENFEINPETGVVTSKALFDFEQMNQLSLTVIAKDNGRPSLSAAATLEINVLDVNDNQPIFPVRSLQLTIPQTAAVGTNFSFPLAMDADGPENGIASYKLNTAAPFVLGGGVTDPVIALSESLPADGPDSYTMYVDVCDKGSPISLCTSLEVVITVEKAAPAAVPMFKLFRFSFSVYENQPTHTEVGQILATYDDPDSEEDIEYGWDSSTLSVWGDVFKIDRETGVIYTKEPLDADSRFYVFSLIATARNPRSTDPPAECNVMVYVTDENDNAPQIEVLSWSADEVPESAEVGTFVLRVSVRDEDRRRSNSRCMCAIDNEHFELVKVYTGEYKINTKTTLDYENQSEHKITIACQDAGKQPQSSVESFVVNVVDVNDNPPVFGHGATLFTINADRNQPGTDLGRVSDVSDADGTEPNNVFSLAIAPGAAEDISENFSLDPKTGAVTLKKALLDGETYRFTVLATDEGTPPLSSDHEVVIQVKL